ncbi:MAG: haloacid dehalogenase-like hydrolase [Erysipelotrichaceae bacterium]|nr:haloacid dehalogenase-like hydrolase [Erysipelotrichaceae bacterium]
MVKRFISANASEILEMSAAELKQSIKASEGRVICSENVAIRQSFIGDITNSEIARSAGADLILLNGVDVLKPDIKGLEKREYNNFVKELHHLVGRPIGVNLEPVDLTAKMAEERILISEGRQASVETIKEIERLGMDFVCFTGNPGAGVTNESIKNTIKLAKEHFSGLIIAGKMHGAGVDEPVVSEDAIKGFIEEGADVILVPAVGTVPGFTDKELKKAVDYAHKHGALVMSAIGTSQEGSDVETIRNIALRNKICGVDIQHIGDAGYGGLAPFENIFAMSVTLRGLRHTVSMLARSINR